MTHDTTIDGAQGRPARAIGLAAVAALGLVLSACATEPQYPARVEPAPVAVQPAPPPAPAPPPPPPAPPVDPDTPAARPSTPVQSRELPPIGASARVTMAPPPNSPAAIVAQPRTGAAAPAAPAPSQVQEVTVASGESLFDVAERTRTPVRALIELNALQPPYLLPAGTRLRVPPPLAYRVTAGDTLFGVARRFNIDPRSLATLNDITLEAGIKVGQTLSLPALARDQGATSQASGPTPTGMAMAETARPPAPAPRAPAQTAQAAPPAPAAPAATPTVSDQEVAAAGRGKFLWPVRGAVISAYGPKGPGQRNDGLNIAAKSGDQVKAAAAGEVVFAGELPGFGNLVLLKHPGGWVTAYAHLSKVGVKMRDQVGQGQTVGEVGQSGGTVDRPQLHFEIRYAPTPRDKARPIDPTILLPS
jgi:murein DD-endopeptidase MepM/ murein hydrolase activator NlpD